VFLFGSSVTTPTPVAASTNKWGGLVVDATASGVATFKYDDAGTSVQPFLTSLAPYLSGEYRVIAMGFEVINTTSELNVQGLVTVYRQPTPALDSAKSVLATSGAYDSGGSPTVHNLQFGYPDVLKCNTPPSTPGEALLLDGSKQWKAKEGCYCVATMNSSENPAGGNTATPILHVSSQDNTAASAGVAWIYVRPSASLPSPFQGITVSVPQITPTDQTSIVTYPTGGVEMQPFNQFGALFTGLSNSTTLQVNATYYIERFPTQQDSDLVVLARNSCHGDSVAKDLYSEIVKEMPVGVPQRMNGMGEWFADAVSSAADFISPVLSAIPLPMAQTIGSGIKMAGGLAKSMGSKKDAVGQTYSPNGNNVSGKQPPVKKKPVAQPAKKKKG